VSSPRCRCPVNITDKELISGLSILFHIQKVEKVYIPVNCYRRKSMLETKTEVHKSFTSTKQVIKLMKSQVQDQEENIKNRQVVLKIRVATNKSLRGYNANLTKIPQTHKERVDRSDTTS